MGEVLAVAVCVWIWMCVLVWVMYCRWGDVEDVEDVEDVFIDGMPLAVIVGSVLTVAFGVGALVIGSHVYLLRGCLTGC